MQTLQQLKNGQLKGAVSLKLSEHLTHFPEEIFDLADTLEKMDLSHNKLSALPADFGRLKKLKIFFCSENPFTVLPEVLADCPLLDIVGFKSNKIEVIPPKALNPNIRWLILTNNKVAHLPAEIGNCRRMQKLMLAGNRLTELPIELSNCKNLSLLRIAANKLTELPAWLITMPKLSWLAFSGNVFAVKPTVSSLEDIHWDELEIAHLLGEGASGVISKATRKHKEGLKDVAVKIFKGDVTSDGLPEDEMDTFITAGEHHGLVRLQGQINAHPEGKKGVVMDLIHPRYFNLGLPPSLDSCTRDVFKPGLKLSTAQVLKIADTIASLAAQLHSKGIMHGDMYAHNTLIDDEGNTLFVDFGAACFYDKNNGDVAASLERIEVSAFGHMLDDLLNLCDTANTDERLLKIRELSDAALVPDVLARPTFKDLHEELGKLL